MNNLRRAGYRMDDGVELMADAWGRPALQPTVLLPGGGQTRHAWKRIAVQLASHGYHAVAIDLRGHGESGWSPDGNYTIDQLAQDLVNVAKSFGRPPVLIGTSLGGIASFLGAGEHDGAIINALVLVDVTPKVDPAGGARIRGFMGSHLVDGLASLEEAAGAIADVSAKSAATEELGRLVQEFASGK